MRSRSVDLTDSEPPARARAGAAGQLPAGAGARRHLTFNFPVGPAAPRSSSSVLAGPPYVICHAASARRVGWAELPGPASSSTTWSTTWSTT